MTVLFQLDVKIAGRGAQLMLNKGSDHMVLKAGTILKTWMCTLAPCR